MNMSEDVTAVSMQVSEKAAEAALSAFKSVLDSVGRLFRELLGMEHDRARAKAQIKAANGGRRGADRSKPPDVTATNLIGIKPGEVSLKDLAENARNTGESLSVSQHGIRDSIDRNNMKLTSKAMNILTKYGVTAEEAKAESIAAFSERVALVQELNAISDEIKELEERPETLRKFWAFKPYYDEYKSLSGRKQEKYKKAHGGTLSDNHELKKKLLEWYPSGHVPSAEKLNKHIAELRKQSAQKNARYKAVKLKADELSQAANEIEQYLRQEQSRDRQKKKNRSVLE